VQEDIKYAVIEGLTNREPKRTFEELMIAIRDSGSDVACCDDGEDDNDEDEDQLEQGKLCKDDEPGWGMGTLTQTLLQHIETLRQK
jgi:hypothetical protein